MTVAKMFFFLVLFSQLTARAAEIDCLKVLELGKVTNSRSEYIVRYWNYYSAFCSTTIDSTKQASERGLQFGIPIGDLPVTFEGSSRDTDTRNYFAKLCTAIRSDSGSLDDVRTRMESLDDKVLQSFDSCVGRPGVHTWAVSDLGEPGELSFFLKYVKSEVGPGSIVLSGDFGTTPSDAFAECSVGAFKKGQRIESAQTSSAACILRSKYKDRRSVVVTFQVAGLPPKTQQILLAKPSATAVIDITQAPKPPKVAAKPPELYSRQNGQLDTAPAGDWISFDVGYSKFLQTGMTCDVQFEGAELGVFDQDDVLRPWSLKAKLVNSDANWSPTSPGFPATPDLQTSGRSSAGSVKWIPLSFRPPSKDCVFSAHKYGYIFSATGRQDVGVRISAQGRACQVEGVASASSEVRLRPWPPGFNEPDGWNCKVKMKLCFYPSHPLFTKDNSCQG